MTTFVFTRTMQYTETIEVQADTYQDALEQAQKEDGVRNHDDTIIDIDLQNIK